MKKLLYFALVFALSTGLVWAKNEKHKVKAYKPKVGDSYHTSKQSNESKVLTLGGTVFEEEKKTIDVEFIEDVLEVKDGVVTKLERKYSRARMTIKKISRRQPDQDEILKAPFVGKTVVIEKTKSGWTFSYADGTPITGKDAALLKEDFGSDDKGDKMEEFLLPPNPLAEGESWNMPIGKVVEAFRMPSSAVDQSQSTGKGTLQKVYHEGSQKMGKISINMKLKLVQFPNFQQADGTMKLTAKGKTCIDGSSKEGAGTTKVSVEVNGVVSARGKQLPLTVKMEGTEKEKTTLVK